MAQHITEPQNRYVLRQMPHGDTVHVYGPHVTEISADEMARLDRGRTVTSAEGHKLVDLVAFHRRLSRIADFIDEEYPGVLDHDFGMTAGDREAREAES